MRWILIAFLVVSLLIASAFPAWASVGLGTRAMGMGGAFTAVADDESAFYWNPAGITQVKYVSIMFGAGAQGEDFDFLEDTLDSISDTEKLNPEDFELGRGYLNLGLIGGVTTRFVGVNFYSENSISMDHPELQTLNIDVSSFNYGTLTIAANIKEKMSIGVNVKKVMTGIGGGRVAIDEENLPNSINETFYADGDGIGIDLGVLYRLSDQVKFGFIARNLGGDIDLEGKKMVYFRDGAEVEIEEKYSDSLELPKEYSVGVSYRPFKNTLLSFDVQKCDSRPPYTPEQTRFRIGFEQTAFWKILALRLGAYTNKDEPLALTAGLGLNLGPLEIGVAGIREEFNDKEANMAVITTGVRF